MSSYQKDGVHYESIQNGNGVVESGSGKKWFKGAILAVILAAVGLTVLHKPAGAATDAAVAKANLPKSKTGKLKLFDETRKLKLVFFLKS